MLSHNAYTHVVLERRALTRDSCVFSNGERVFGWLPPLRPSEPRYSLLPALHSRAAASSPPSGAALPPPPRLPESRCRHAASNSPPSIAALPPPHRPPELRCLLQRPPEPRCRLQLPSASLQSRARCRLLHTLPSPLSREHATPSSATY